MFARIGAMRALHRNVERVFNPDRKETQWGKRKLKKDQWAALSKLATHRNVSALCAGIAPGAIDGHEELALTQLRFVSLSNCLISSMNHDAYISSAGLSVAFDSTGIGIPAS
jgi:hypothetical protein